MAGYVVESGLYSIEDVGDVYVTLKGNARSIRARWKGGRIHVTAPVGIEYDKLRQVLLDFAPRLQQCKPQSMYYIGQHMEFPEFVVDLTQQSYSPERMIVTLHDGKGEIMIGDNWDMEAPETIRQISTFLCRMAQRLAPSTLIPLAQKVSQRVGKAPAQWTISNGHRTLGHCSSNGTIALSYALLFFPPHLREYVICHELAHLSEMSHSKRFHQICDSYCNGQEQALLSELKRHQLPIIQ